MHFTNKHPVTELHILSLPLITEQENLDEFISAAEAHGSAPDRTGPHRTKTFQLKQPDRREHEVT